MKSFQQRKRFRNVFYSKPVLTFLIIVVFIFVWELSGFMGKMNVTIENRKISENKLVELQKQKIKLTADISKLKTDSGIEENIRDKFGLVKEGEGEIIVVEDKNSPEVPKQESRGFFSFFSDWFK